MDILPKAFKVNTYAETIGLGNIFNTKKGPNFHVRQNHSLNHPTTSHKTRTNWQTYWEHVGTHLGT